MHKCLYGSPRSHDCKTVSSRLLRTREHNGAHYMLVCYRTRMDKVSTPHSQKRQWSKRSPPRSPVGRPCTGVQPGGTAELSSAPALLSPKKNVPLATSWPLSLPTETFVWLATHLHIGLDCCYPCRRRQTYSGNWEKQHWPLPPNNLSFPLHKSRPIKSSTMATSSEVELDWCSPECLKLSHWFLSFLLSFLNQEQLIIKPICKWCPSTLLQNMFLLRLWKKKKC